MSTSLLTPFQVVGGRIGSTTDLTRQVEQKIVNTMTTDRLERIGIADFGVGVNQLLFEPVDDLMTADFKVDAQNELSDRISGAQIIDIRIANTSETTANITVLYKLPLAAIRQTTFQIALPGALTEESVF